MLELTIVAAAVAPALLLLLLFIRLDRFPEPTPVIVATFLLGMVAVVPVVLLGLLLEPWVAGVADPVRRVAFDVAFRVSVPEEFVKFVVLYCYCMRHSQFDEPMDGLVYGMTASLGFACLENIGYLLGAGDAWVEVAILRAVLSVPSHGLTGALMGFFAARSVFEPRRRGTWLLLALVVPMLLHGLYDFPLFLIGPLDPAQRPALTDLAVTVPPMIVMLDLLWALSLFRGLGRLQRARLAAMASAAGRGPDAG